MATRTLKVFGSSPVDRPYVPETLSRHQQTRHIVAATSKAAACRLLGTRPDFTTETFNEEVRRFLLGAKGAASGRA